MQLTVMFLKFSLSVAMLQKQPFRLITIPVSHYCEKVRWALQRFNLPYIEEPHVPLFHRLTTRKSGGKSTPILVTESGNFTDSTDILHYLNGIAPVDAKLYLEDDKLRREVEKLADLFDKQLGPATRQWAYFYLIDRPDLMQKIWCQNTPAIERAFFPILFPLMRTLVRKGYNITAESAANSYDKIQRIFENVNERLADGRSYLVGDSFSAADLTFACLAAPAVLPAEYKAYLPKLEELPSQMAAQIKQLRSTPAGVYVLKLFREERDRQV